ncbi:uncharacterized protein LOC131241313 isoform X5 [Magnolia sinica]|uniref:uncharacterized protein LOC131241313 isoform X5 n=1 Tax=Magnolia sinica TaxID=86752 RepID=UPI002659ACEE|nr:uncharacterized protein LOC131241313 isoform X5 [Magnolia sinica]
MMSSCLLLPVSRAHFPSRNFQTSLFPLGRGTNCFGFNDNGRKKRLKRERSSWCWRGIVCGILPVDPWAPTIDSQSIASQLFAASLLPYLGFLYFITKSKTSPKLTLFGFYFLLAFVGATMICIFKTLLIPFMFSCRGSIVQSRLEFTQRCITELPCPMSIGYMVVQSRCSLSPTYSLSWG